MGETEATGLGRDVGREQARFAGDGLQVATEGFIRAVRTLAGVLLHRDDPFVHQRPCPLLQGGKVGGDAEVHAAFLDRSDRLSPIVAVTIRCYARLSHRPCGHHWVTARSPRPDTGWMPRRCIAWRTPASSRLVTGSNSSMKS